MGGEWFNGDYQWNPKKKTDEPKNYVEITPEQQAQIDAENAKRKREQLNEALFQGLNNSNAPKEEKSSIAEYFGWVKPKEDATTGEKVVRYGKNVAKAVVIGALTPLAALTGCSKEDFEPINAHAHAELTPQVLKKNADLAINYLNNPDSLKARLKPEDLKQFYQITKTDDNVPIEYFLGQQGSDGKIAAYINLGKSQFPVRISPIEDIKPTHIVSYITETGDTFKTTDEQIEYNYQVIEGQPTIVIGNRVSLDVLKTDSIQNKPVVDYIHLLPGEKPAVYTLDDKNNIIEEFDKKYNHTYGNELKLDTPAREAINSVINFFGAKLGSKDLVTNFATTDSDKGSIEKLMVGLTSYNLDEAEIKFNLDGHEFVGIPQSSKDGKTVNIGEHCTITQLDDKNINITVDFKVDDKYVTGKYNIKNLNNGEFEVMRKGESYEEIIHHKGDIDYNNVIHHKGDIDYNNVIHHKGDIDYNNVIHHKGDIDYNNVIHHKGDIDYNNVIHHKGDIDYNNVIHHKGDIDYNNVIHHKGDIDYNNVIHHKGDIDYNNVIHHKGDPDPTKPIYETKQIPRDVDPNQKQFVDNVAKFFGKYSQDEILTHIKMGDDSYGDLYKGLELNFDDKTSQVKISIGEFKNLEVGKDCNVTITNDGISIDVKGTKFFIEEYDGTNFNIIHPNGLEENYPITDIDTISATIEKKEIVGYEQYDYDEYGTYDHDEYGTYDHDEYGTYDHDEYGTYDHDEYGTYDHDEYGTYDHDEYGTYDHDEYGTYDHDEYGTYDHDVTRTVDTSVTENIRVKEQSEFDTERIEKADEYVDTNRQVLTETRKTAKEYYEIKKKLIEDVRDKAGHDYDLLQQIAVSADADAKIG